MSRNSLLLPTAVSASLVFGAACSKPAGPVKIRKEYAAVAAPMERHSDGFSIDESSEASVLLDREWSLQGDDSFVEGKSGFGAIPADELVNRVSVSSLGFLRWKAAYDG